MELDRLWNRLLLVLDWVWRRLAAFLLWKLWGVDDLHTSVTFRAVADAVLPETPELEAELGPEYVPGGLAIDIDEFLVTYVDDFFQFGLPNVGSVGNVPLSKPVAHVLDAAALLLLARSDEESSLDGGRVTALLGPGDPAPWAARAAAGPFAKLSRRDRLRTLTLLDKLELSVSPFEDTLFEVDAGVISQLVVGFVEFVYYSEWDGYDEFTQPPGQRTHPNDPAAVQGWRQTGYPGVAPGYAALRGYLGTDGGPLGEGETWTTIDPDAPSPVRVMRESGGFAENEYDTGDYEEPFPDPSEGY